MPHPAHQRSSYTSLRLLRDRWQAFRRGRSLLVLLLVLLTWSLCLGWGLAQAKVPRSSEAIAQQPSTQQPSTQTPAKRAPANQAPAKQTPAKQTPGTQPAPVTPAGAEQLLPPPNSSTPATRLAPTVRTGQATIGTVDVVPANLKIGQDVYLEHCASCHIGLPPQVMPTETWRQLIQDSQHYGAQIQPLVAPNLQIVWQYIRNFSRPQGADEDIPYRVYQSRYFKALHPKVKLPTRVGLTSCVSCHPGAGNYDFRSLTAEWQNAP